MAEAKDGAAWNRTFAIIAQLYNANRPSKSKPVDPMSFYPWQIEEKSPQPRKLTPDERQRMRELMPKKD